MGTAVVRCVYELVEVCIVLCVSVKQEIGSTHENENKRRNGRVLKNK